MALDCEIAEFTKWDRKSYYYPDLPKNYQISQYDLPLGGPGYIEIPLDGGKTKRVRIRRAHLEEDAGKNLHTAGYHSQVDLNRAGTPLLEIVTEPDLNSAEEVRALAVELQRIVRYLGVSEADMQKGHMRFEPNINLVIEQGGPAVQDADRRGQEPQQLPGPGAERRLRDPAAARRLARNRPHDADGQQVQPRLGRRERGRRSSSGRRKRRTTTATSPIRTWSR